MHGEEEKRGIKLKTDEGKSMMCSVKTASEWHAMRKGEFVAAGRRLFSILRSTKLSYGQSNLYFKILKPLLWIVRIL